MVLKDKLMICEYNISSTADTESTPTLRSDDIVNRLREERDEARREICIRACDTLGAVIGGSPATPQDYAKERGWDCFKDDTDG